MPKYFCEYCGIYLTHSSPGGRYQHSHGRKHINNKIEYYSQFLYEFKQNTYDNLLAMTSKISRGIQPKEIKPGDSSSKIPPVRNMTPIFGGMEQFALPLPPQIIPPKLLSSVAPSILYANTMKQNEENKPKLN